MLLVLHSICLDLIADPMAFDKKLSLNDLLSALHDAISSFSRGVEKLTERNDEMGIDEINELRDYVKERLGASGERAENEKLLKLILLLKEDKEALALMKKDTEDWAKFLDAINEHIGLIPVSGKTEEDELKNLKAELLSLHKMFGNS